MRSLLSFLAFLFLLFVSACSSARMDDHESDRLFQQGRYDEAAARLSKSLQDKGEDSRDGLLYLLDIGLSLHAGGKLDESTAAFLRADKVAEIKDYTSLAAEASTLLLSENTKQYKAEDFENVLISAYLAMNYALLSKWDDALVEAKRVNRKLYRMVTEGKKKYRQNAFAKYLSGLMYEVQSDFDSAFLDYKEAHELAPYSKQVEIDLFRMAKVTRRLDDLDDVLKVPLTLSADEKNAVRFEKSASEIIVLYENGISPVKRPNPNFRTIPQFYSRFNPVRFASVSVDGGETGQTEILHDIEATAIEDLDEKYAGIIAKKVGGLVAKEALGYGVARATDSPLLGFLTKLFFYVADQADLRSWNLLPRDLQIFRIQVESGTHIVRVIPGAGATVFEKMIAVEKGKKVFVNFRYMP